MASEASTPSKKPRVVSLGTPKFISQEYLSDFQQDFEFSVLEAYDREETLKRLPKDIQENGPISAFIVRMNQLPYEPFDEELLHPLAPDCRIVASAKAGFDAYDVKWMKEQGIWFCNTVNAVAHTTANMAIFLMLAVLRNATNAERSARRGGWRNGAPGIVPTRDPSGLTIGILGMGSIGKVKDPLKIMLAFPTQRLTPVIVYRGKGNGL